MKELRPDLSRLAIVSAVLSLTLFIAILLIYQTPRESIVQSVTKLGAVLTLIGIFWAFFERHGWRYSWLRLWGWLTDLPVLHGRWEGVVCRDGEGEVEHEFVLEISQTFSILKFRTFGEKSSGESLSVSIIAKDELHSMWEVNSVWRTEARQLKDVNAYEHFTGCSTWKVSYDLDSKTYQITDRYFTSRKTSGTIKVTRISSRILGKFK
jgi:hypothetical protein